MSRFLLGLVTFCLAATALVLWVKIGLSLQTPSQSTSTTGAALSDTLVNPSVPVAASKGKFRVPILMYHYIRDYQIEADPLGIQLSVSPGTLSQQLDELQAAGYQTISLSDLAAGQVKEKSVIITFDDGYADAYKNALPVLQSHQMTATFFVVGDFVGVKGYMARQQIELLKSAGMEIGAHTMSHVNLANQTRETAYYQIGASLEGTDYVFSYPSGQYKSETVDLAYGLGVKAAVTTNVGVATETSSLFELPRIRVKNFTNITKRISEEVAIADGTLDASQRSKD